MLRFHCCLQTPSVSSGLNATFDEAAAYLAGLPRMFLEPDGSFVWTGDCHDGTAWQVDGNLIDRGASLAVIELKGHCPPEQFDQLLQSAGWPAHTLAFQLPRRGIVLAESEFRELAATTGGAM